MYKLIIIKSCKVCQAKMEFKYIARDVIQDINVIILEKVNENEYTCRMTKKCYSCGFASEFVENLVLDVI